MAKVLPTWPIAFFFTLILLVGLLSFRDFGVSWDEKTQFVIGLETYETVLHGRPVTENPGRRFHGPSFEFLLYTLQEILPIKTARQVFFMRHLVSYLLFSLGLFFFYLLCKKHFRSTAYGLLGAAMLFFSPRIFGHAFINTRDIPALVFFIIAIYTLLTFLDKRTLRSLLFHALACALLLSIRITGILVPALTILFLVLDTVCGESQWKRTGETLGIYLASWIALSILFWPLLWHDPLSNFLAAFENMSSKGGGGFYMGEKIDYNPWHWVPVWLTITTPLLYIFLFLVGLGSAAHTCMRDRMATLHKHRNLLLFFLWLLLPIASLVLFDAKIFDTWRHLFFIYPAFLLIALEGLKWLYQSASSRRVHRGITTIVCASFLLTGFWMVRNHPLQYIYFSIPTKFVEGKFELDYWGLSYRQAYEYILQNDERPVMIVLNTSSPGYVNLNMLTTSERERIRFSPQSANALYVFDNFRWKEYKRTLSDQSKVHSIKTNSMEVLGIYRNDTWDEQTLERSRTLPTEGLLFVFPDGSIDPELFYGTLSGGGEIWTLFKI